jgi:hypothetical protein
LTDLAPVQIEAITEYIVKAIRKIQKENILSMTVKAARVKDFIAQCDAYFAGTVFVGECNSWYRQNGKGDSADKVTGVWPGSAMHCQEILRSPRWEDFEYEYIPEENGAPVNQLAFFGNGLTVPQLAEKRSPEQLAWYCVPDLLEKEVGVPVAPYPEQKLQYQLRPYSY